MNQALLILADFAPQGLSNTQTIGLQEIDLEKLFKNSVSNPSPVTYLYIHPIIETVFKKTVAQLKMIKAAGGIVKNGHGEYLYIHRLGKWDLPKGKVEENEKIKVAACREVEEECGIEVDYLGIKSYTTYHLYTLRGKTVIKQTSWYDMGVNKTPELIPQTEEDIDMAEWLSVAELDKVLSNTYPMIGDITRHLIKIANTLDA